MRKSIVLIPSAVTADALVALTVGRLWRFLWIAVVGILPATLSRPCSAAIFVSSGQVGGVFEFDSTTGQFIKSFGANVLGNPSGLTFDSSGNLLAASRAGANPVVAFNPSTGAEIGPRVIGDGGILDYPQAIKVGPDGNLYAVDFAFGPVPNSILRYDATTGAFIDVFAAPAGNALYEPFDLAFGSDKNLYITSLQNSSVVELDGSTGAVVRDFVPTYSGGLNGATGLAFGPDGNLYVSSFYSNQIMEYNGATGAFMGTFASGGGLLYPEGLAFGPDGNLYVASNGNDQILEYSGKTGARMGVFASSPGLGPSFVAFSPSPAAVPEPSSLAIMGSALALLSFWRFAPLATQSARRLKTSFDQGDRLL